jgi:histone acetyltransferase (RNA polymerase elongator complex component)
MSQLDLHKNQSDQIEDIEDIVQLTPLKKFRHEVEISNVKLEKMIIEMLNMNIQTRDEMQDLIKKFRKKYKESPSNSQLLKTYKNMCDNGSLIYEKRYESILQAHQVRSNSGVNVVAVTLSPYPFTKDDRSDEQSFSCQWNCKFCPSKPGFPRSYVDGEPGIDRGLQHNYEPIAQINDRLETYKRTGHAADKLEIIVLGGTWSSYPVNYQYWFITSNYYGANMFNNNMKREMLSLEEEIKINETTSARIIGLTLETRPDCINLKELIKFRRMGVTRVQIGVQHINWRVLSRCDRRCKLQTMINSVKWLKDNCFKVDIHIMLDLPKPALPGYDNDDIKFSHEELEEFRYLTSKKDNFTVEEKNRFIEIEKRIQDLKEMIDWDFDMYEEDKKMLDFIIKGEDLQVDQWKLYPCQVMPWSPLEPENEIGLHASYMENKTENGNELIDILLYAQQNVPRWVRINRVVRDIPTKYVLAGCDCSNLQQYLINIMNKQGKTCQCIRCKEVKNKAIDYNTAKLCVTKYRASGGDDYFISFEDQEEKTLYGFLRLRLSEDAGYMGDEIVFDELVNTALIRELHVYGQTIAVSGDSISSSSQHMGFGKRLLKAAEDIAIKNGYKKIAVISGVGVKEYYRKQNYVDGNYFLLKDLTNISLSSV